MTVAISSKDQQAKYLARTHKRIEQGTISVFRLLAPGALEDEVNEPVKLLEVSKSTIPAGIRPIYFSAQAEGFPFSTVIVEITPKEYKALKSHQLDLPNGWQIGQEIVSPKKTVRR